MSNILQNSLWISPILFAASLISGGAVFANPILETNTQLSQLQLGEKAGTETQRNAPVTTSVSEQFQQIRDYRGNSAKPALTLVEGYLMVVTELWHS
jgi:hypothetical protein